ncbi:MAG: hypothetical protein AB1486_22590 [Planctomycetota bacterium]
MGVWPRHGWVGLALIATAWPLNWGLSGLRTHFLFFPLWLGYILTVDALTLQRTGSSLLHRSGRSFLELFVLSVPLWWLFELVNLRLHNWEYLGREQFSDLEYAVLCSLSFSTVVPAVLGTAELMRSLPWMKRFARGPRLRATPRFLATLAILGALMLGALILWPRACYPLVWVSGVLLCEPLCVVLARRSLLTDLERGDWRLWMSLWSGVLACAFFWEMWNYWSYPKWVYHIPGVGFARLFEMPILGYLGYLPFSLELYLFQQLLIPRIPQRSP